MTFFTNKMVFLRRIGRKAVLPVSEIQKRVKEKIPSVNGNILDLGAGTLVWSKWLFEQYGVPVLAVDTFYDTEGTQTRGGIEQFTDYFCCIKDKDVKLLWMCDVIHHLTPDFFERVKKSVVEKQIMYVVVKDIDCRHKFGNFMNRMHDWIINHDKIHDVDPMKIEQYLSEHGYLVSYTYIPKLWYPHFLLIAEKKI